MAALQVADDIMADDMFTQHGQRSSCNTSFLLEGHRNVRVVQQLRECVGTEDTHVHFMYIEVCTKCS